MIQQGAVHALARAAKAWAGGNAKPRGGEVLVGFGVVKLMPVRGEGQGKELTVEPARETQAPRGLAAKLQLKPPPGTTPCRENGTVAAIAHLFSSPRRTIEGAVDGFAR